MYIYINESTPTQTNTQTLGIHVRICAPGFGAHRICAGADPDFHFFRLLNLQRGPYA